MVNQETGLPGDGLGTAENLNAEREKIYHLNWYAIIPPEVNDLIKYNF